jgi:hypothetical protein
MNGKCFMRERKEGWEGWEGWAGGSSKGDGNKYL